MKKKLYKLIKRFKKIKLFNKAQNKKQLTNLIELIYEMYFQSYLCPLKVFKTFLSINYYKIHKKTKI